MFRMNFFSNEFEVIVWKKEYVTARLKLRGGVLPSIFEVLMENFVMTEETGLRMDKVGMR